MQSANALAVTLVSHPENRSGVVHRIGASIRRQGNGSMEITYSIGGDLARLKVPPPGRQRTAHGLWQHTCCECFVALPGDPGYHEFNFSPSGEWAAYAFSGYRKGAAIDDETLNPQIAVRRVDDALELDASLPLGRFPALRTRGRLVLALSAVIEDGDGTLSYWALKHPAGKPDFHHRDSFALELG